MRPVAQGRPGTEVIPTGWAAAHAPVVEGTMRDAVAALRDPTATSGMGWNPTSEQMESIPAEAYWTGGVRVQMLNQQGREPVSAGDQETVADYLVVVPVDVEAAEGHRVLITDSDDPLLNDHELRVVTVVRGTHRWERDLFCELVG